MWPQWMFNFFHCLRIGQCLAEWFCMEPVRARDVSMCGREVSGQMVEDDQWIHRCAGALPIRSGWSLYFAQSVNERALHEVEGIQDVSVMNDRAQPCVLDISNPGRVFGYIHVDNLRLLSLDLRRSLGGLASLQNEFDAMGLRIHEASLAEDVQTALGHVLECRQHVTETSPAPMVAALPRAGCFVEADWSYC